MAIQGLNALDAENAVAGSILLDSRAFDAVSDFLSADSFQSELCRSIYQAAQSLSVAGKPIDPVAISRHLQETGVQIGNQTLSALMEITPTVANAKYYAGIVLDNAKRHGLRQLAERILEDDSTPTDDMLSSVSADISALVEKAVGSRCMTSLDMMRGFYDDLVDREAGKKNFVSSGFQKLDKVLGGGFLNGGLYIILLRHIDSHRCSAAVAIRFMSV